MNNSRLSDIIARDYYKTTAARGHISELKHYQESALRWRPRICEWLPKEKDAVCIELGCGCGEILFLLETMGYKNTRGVDLCREELAKARCFVSGELVEMDLLEYLDNLSENSVDYFIALNILEHLSKDKLLSVLQGISKALKPEGVVIAMVPNSLSPFGSTTRYWDLTHELAFTPNNFRQLAPLTGFSPNPEFKEYSPMPHGFLSSIRFLLWQLLRAGIATWYLIETGNTKGGIYTMDMLVRLKVSK